MGQCLSAASRGGEHRGARRSFRSEGKQVQWVGVYHTCAYDLGPNLLIMLLVARLAPADDIPLLVSLSISLGI